MKKINYLVRSLSINLYLVLILTTVSMALDYPTKPIQIVIPAPPGGSADIAARILGPKVSSIIGQPIIVVSKPGGGGALAAKMLASATEPDGYTILGHWTGIVLIPILNPGIGYQMGDFTAVAVPVCTPYMIAVKADAPWKTLDDFIKDAKKHPGKFTYSTGGFGSGYHFTGELFKAETGTDIVHIPMEGDAPAVTAVLGGHVEITFSGSSTLSPHIKAGTLRILAQMYPTRLKEFPNIPSIKELGYPSVTTYGWLAYFVPAKTPKPIVEKLGKAFGVAAQDKDVIDKIEKTGYVVQSVILEKATKFLQDEDKRWRDVAKKARMLESLKK
jgi:tripartite-type tricarboxylate transporter receptor subunit TctC